MNIEDIFAVIMLAPPLIISLWFLVKSANVKINRIRCLEINDKNRKKDIMMIISLFVAILIILILGIFLLLMAIAPAIIFAIPLPLRLFPFIIIGIIYGCFAALFMGLGEAVGAGGSAANVIKSLSGYLRETLEIKQTKQLNDTQTITTEEKDDRTSSYRDK